MKVVATHFIDLPAIEGVEGTVVLPGSKSISNRTLLLAAICTGDTVVRDVLQAEDTRYMLEALRALGVQWVEDSPRALRIHGTGGRIPVKNADIFLGNAGTAFRPLTAVLAVLGGEYRLSGVPRMHERPIGDLVDALRGCGARIDYLAKPGYPPLQIHEGQIETAQGVDVRGNVSSQFVTGLLMALPLVGRESVLRIQGELISKPYVEITLKSMERFGVSVRHRDLTEFFVPAAAYRSPGEIYVEGDASTASYFLAASVLSSLQGAGALRVEGVGEGSIQGDVRFIDLLEQMGARVAMGPNWIEAVAGEEVKKRRKLHAFDADLNHIPDAAMTAAVLALFADGPSALRNIGSWRVKETDRLAAMATELRKTGARVDEGPDYLRIAPPNVFTHAAIDTYDDHRIAMSFSLVSFGAVPVRINEPDCVRKTFPEYFDVLQSVSRQTHTR